MDRSKRLTSSSTHSDMKRPNAVVSEDLVICKGDHEGPKDGTPTLRPVLLTLVLVAFFEVGNHDNYGRPLLPYQPPEVHQHVLLWT